MKHKDPSSAKKPTIQPVGRWVDELTQRLGNERIREEASIRGAWVQVLGRDRANNAQVDGLKGGVLRVRVANEAMGKEIRMLASHIIHACNQRLHTGAVRKIQVRVGPVTQESGPRSARPRRKARQVGKKDEQRIAGVSEVISDESLRTAFEGWMRTHVAWNETGDNKGGRNEA